MAPGGYFDDLASHGLDLISYLLGEVGAASGFSTNQQGFYSAKDAVTGCWLHRCGATGSGSWTFGAGERRDRVEIFGSEGTVSFAVFGEVPLELRGRARTEKVVIENPRHIQLPTFATCSAISPGSFSTPRRGPGRRTPPG